MNSKIVQKPAAITLRKLFLGFLFFSGSFALADELADLTAKAYKNDAEAQVALGYSYTTGLGVVKDPFEAVKWYRKAADQRNSQAQLLLGSCYASGQGVAKDLVEAARLLRLAALQGNGDAQMFLGTIYTTGRGVSKDYAQAYAWLTIAAASGNRRARESLPGIELLATPEQKSEGAKLARELTTKINTK